MLREYSRSVIVTDTYMICADSIHLGCEQLVTKRWYFSHPICVHVHTLSLSLSLSLEKFGKLLCCMHTVANMYTDKHLFQQQTYNNIHNINHVSVHVHTQG